MPLMAFQDIGLEQRIVGDAPQLDAAVGKNMAVVLDVLAELGAPRTLQPGLESGQYGLARQLLRRAGINMAQGYVGGATRFGGQRNADQFRAQRIKIGRASCRERVSTDV